MVMEEVLKISVIMILVEGRPGDQGVLIITTAHIKQLMF